MEEILREIKAKEQEAADMRAAAQKKLQSFRLRLLTTFPQCVFLTNKNLRMTQ